MERRRCVTLKMYVFEHHMFTGDEGRAIQSHACIVGTYTAPEPMQVHWTTLVQSQGTLWFALSPKHLAEH